MSKPAKSLRVSPRIRIYAGEEITLGPGKAELLRSVAETGSLSKAARSMKMSYMKAWLLVQTMNRSFRHPLIIAERGGSGGGGAILTPHGKRVLDLYAEMEAKACTAMAPSWKRLKALLKAP